MGQSKKPEPKKPATRRRYFPAKPEKKAEN